MDRIIGPFSKFDTKVLGELFPDFDPESLQRKTNQVDILPGVTTSACTQSMRRQSVGTRTAKLCVTLNNPVPVYKGMERQLKNFIIEKLSQQETTPRCDGCRCGKCPAVGHNY